MHPDDEQWRDEERFVRPLVLGERGVDVAERVGRLAIEQGGLRGARRTSARTSGSMSASAAASAHGRELRREGLAIATSREEHDPDRSQVEGAGVVGVLVLEALQSDLVRLVPPAEPNSMSPALAWKPWAKRSSRPRRRAVSMPSIAVSRPSSR